MFFLCFKMDDAHGCRTFPKCRARLSYDLVSKTHYFRNGLNTSPLLSWYASCDWWRVQFLVIPFPPCGLRLLCCLLAWTLVLAPGFFFSPLFGCFHFIKFGRVSSSSPNFQNWKKFWKFYCWWDKGWFIFGSWKHTHNFFFCSKGPIIDWPIIKFSGTLHTLS